MDSEYTGVSMDSDDDSTEWNEIETDGYDEIESMCLFCDESSAAIEQIFIHMNEIHQFDLKGFILSNGFDCYEIIQLINCIRSEGLLPNDLIGPPFIWQLDGVGEKYYKPIIENDTLLTFQYND